MIGDKEENISTRKKEKPKIKKEESDDDEEIDPEDKLF